ncbi:hypothetical protein RB597_010200 [Gaeumannomyces tritici]
MPRQLLSDFCDEFREWVDKNKLQGTCLGDPTQPVPRYFVPPEALEEYWTGDDNNKLSRLLVDALDLNVPLDNVRERLLCTLSTLLYISDKSCSRVRNIEHIHRDLETGISDKSLPVDRDGRLRTAFPNDPDTADRFYHEQFLFCPVVPTTWDTNLSPNAVLPLQFDQSLQKGDDDSTPTLAKYRPHSGFGLQDKLYVLKQFPPEELGESYTAERNMYRRLGQYNECSNDNPAQYFLKCPMAFRQNGRAALLLEYADGGSLEDMFHRNNRPFTRQGVLDMWDELVKLFRALHSLHQINTYTKPAAFTYLHQDIKPGNILVFWDPGDYNSPARGEYGTTKCCFKLADFGQSCEVKDPLNRAAPYNPGNRTYSAPAHFAHDKHVGSTGRPASKETDIWSLVCVLFETAVWITGGEAARLAFQRARVQENKANNPGLVAGGYEDSFHNGLVRLKALEDARMQIEESSMKCDDITIDIVDHLLDNILREPLCMPPADYTSNKIQLIINKHRHCTKGTAAPVTPLTPNNRSCPTMSPPGATGLSDSPELISGSRSSVLQPAWRNGQQTRHSTMQLQTSMSPLYPDHHPTPNSTRSDPDSAAREHLLNQGPAISIPPSPSPTNTALGYGSTDSTAWNGQAGHRGYTQPGGSAPGPPSPLYLSPPPHPSAASPWAPQRSWSPQPLKHPHVTIETVCAYRKNKKREDKNIQSLIEEVKGHFQGRDQVILIDDHPSMIMLKNELRKTCEALAAIVKGVDSDGIEVRFASRPSEGYVNVKSATDMLDVFDKHFGAGNTGSHSMMAKAMLCILQDEASSTAQRERSRTMQSTLNRRQSTRRSFASRAATSIGLAPSPRFGPPSPVSSASSPSQSSGTTIYVLTDGVWGVEEPQPDDRTLGVAEHIRDFIRRQQDLGLARNRVVIQLVNVGNDAVGTQRLEDLDDRLWSNSPHPQADAGDGDARYMRWDIVDTKPSTAPLWSILVGAIDKGEDERQSPAGMDDGMPLDAGAGAAGGPLIARRRTTLGSR